MTKKIILPGLIIKSQHAAAIIQGVSLRDGSKVFKTVECRGYRCFTGYRGAVAVFASKAYDTETEDRCTWFGAYSEQTEAQRKRGTAVKLSSEQDLHYRAWSRYTGAWSYSLVGFARLTGVTKSSSVRSDAARLELHKQATDFRGMWMHDPPATYLHVESMYELTAASGPKFDKVCLGCTTDPADIAEYERRIGGKKSPDFHARSQHVNWQHVGIDAADVPNHVQKEVSQW